MTTHPATAEQLQENAMVDDAYKAAETRGYARGYQAGKKRRDAERAKEAQDKADQAFVRRAFLAALPFAMTQDAWKIGEKPISSVEERVDFAWRIARASLKREPYPR